MVVAGFAFIVISTNIIDGPLWRFGNAPFHIRNVLLLPKCSVFDFAKFYLLKFKCYQLYISMFFRVKLCDNSCVFNYRIFWINLSNNNDEYARFRLTCVNLFFITSEVKSCYYCFKIISLLFFNTKTCWFFNKFLPKYVFVSFNRKVTWTQQH